MINLGSCLASKYMAPPLDFINASPKSGIAVFEVKKRFDSKVLFNANEHRHPIKNTAERVGLGGVLCMKRE